MSEEVELSEMIIEIRKFLKKGDDVEWKGIGNSQ